MKKSFVGLALVSLLYVFTLFLLWGLSRSSTPVFSSELQNRNVAGASSSRFQRKEGLPNPNEVLSAVNGYRKDHGMGPLLANQDLEKIAQSRLTDMSTNRYYAHKNNQGLYYFDIMRSFGIRTEYSCENLDLSVSPEISQYIQDWSNSTKGHRKCMLDNRISQAGYAVGKLLIDDQGTENYIIVAIHSTDIHQ